MELLLEKPSTKNSFKEKLMIPVGVSNRHVHLSSSDLELLFGENHQLRPRKMLNQPGEFACEEMVTLVGPKGVIPRVRIVGPLRCKSQVEISVTDSYNLGVDPPVRISGHLHGTPGLTLVGPEGTISLKEGVIIAARHIHMPSELALKYDWNGGTRVQVQVKGIRAQILEEVVLRISPQFNLELHVDTDEANGALLKNGDQVILIH